MSYVFIDDSNLWISGQTAAARKLRNVKKDPRFRIDYGKLLLMVKKERKLARAFLSGSMPPPYDTIWKAIEDKFKLKLFERSHGKEKKVDNELSCQMMETLYKELPKNEEDAVFIVVTGDSDLMPAIKRVLNEKVRIELWSWKHSVSSEFTALPTTDPNFTASFLDDVPHKDFSSINYMYKEINNKDVDLEHALQCTDVPKGETQVQDIAEYFENKNLVFYIWRDNFQDEGLIIEFPDINPDEVLDMISDDFRYNI